MTKNWQFLLKESRQTFYRNIFVETNEFIYSCTWNIPKNGGFSFVKHLRPGCLLESGKGEDEHYIQEASWLTRKQIQNIPC